MIELSYPLLKTSSEEPQVVDFVQRLFSTDDCFLGKIED
jgi:hypothetical protein